MSWLSPQSNTYEILSDVNALDAFQQNPSFIYLFIYLFIYCCCCFDKLRPMFLWMFNCLFSVYVGDAEITFPSGEDLPLHVLGYFLLACINRSNNTK